MFSESAMSPLYTYFAVMSFVFGTLVGSFCNVCICRWPAGLSVVKPRSRCPKCNTLIAWYDNIPIISWFVLMARCRKCRLPISVRYPAIEALTGLLFLGIFWRFGLIPATPVYMLLTAAMVVVTFQDLDDWTIPDEITLPGIPVGVLLSIAGMLLGERLGLRVSDPIDSLLGVLLGGGILYLMDVIAVAILKKPGMGMGDVKLLAMLGAFIGWQGVLGTIMLASIVGSVVGVLRILYYRMHGLKAPAPPVDEEEPAPGETSEPVAKEDSDGEPETMDGNYLPFGPFLAWGGILYLCFGPELLRWYIRMLTIPQ